MKHVKNIVVAGLVALLAVVLALPSPTAFADSASLSIVPRKDYLVKAGDSVKDKLVIRNLDAKEELKLTLRVVDFTFTDDGGTPKLMLAADAPQTTWSLKPFLTVPEYVTIAPRTSKTLNMKVDIPKGHGAGSYYSAIVYSSGAPDGGNVGLSASGVTLVFNTIPGKVKEDLKLEKFGAYHNAIPGKPAGYTFITTKKPQSIAYTLANNGNVTESPAGSITMKHMFGQEQTISDVNPTKSLALIGQTRTFVSCIKLKEETVAFNGGTTRSRTCDEPTLWPGYYRLSTQLFYGQNGNNTQEIRGTGSFWYLPWWFIIVMSVALLVIAFYIWRIKRMVNKKFGTPRRNTVRRR